MPGAAHEINLYVQHTLDVLRDQGIDVLPLVQRHAIDETALSGDTGVITQQQYSALLDEVIRRYQLPGLGLLDGRGVNLLDHGLLGYAMFASASRNVGAAMTKVPKIIIMNNALEYWTRSASLVHTDLEGKTDAPFHPNVRYYMTNGAPHGGAWTRRRCAGPWRAGHRLRGRGRRRGRRRVLRERLRDAGGLRHLHGHGRPRR